jgi:hypothetical protein
MKNRLRRALALCLSSSFAMLSGCAASADGPDVEAADVDTDESELVTLEYDGADSAYFPSVALYPRAETSFGRAGFETSGDVLRLQDYKSDGRSVGIHWKVYEGGHVVRRGICRSTQGKGVEAACNKNFPEGLRLEIRLGRCDGTVYSCRTLTGWTDWTDWKGGAT